VYWAQIAVLERLGNQTEGDLKHVALGGQKTTFVHEGVKFFAEHILRKDAHNLTRVEPKRVERL
jgi:hypothetical protein